MYTTEHLTFFHRSMGHVMKHIVNYFAKIICISALLSGPLLAEEKWDSEFLSATLPDTLITDEIFFADITIKNVGDTVWPMSDLMLHSMLPDSNYIWGTYFALNHHGDDLSPGDAFTYSDNFRAPSTPGTYPFAWKCFFKKSKQLFGPILLADSIVVIARTEKAPVKELKESSNPELVAPSDIKYVGSFKVPKLSGYENTYVETGMTLKMGADGSKHFLLNTGTYTQLLYEIKIPDPSELSTIENNDHTTIPTAELVREWETIKWDAPVDEEELDANRGFWLDTATNILYWTHMNSYYAGAPFPVLSATQLHHDGSVTNLKYWYLPPVSLWKAYWHGVTVIPQQFADSYTGGRTLGIGFGGCFSIIQTASRGPALAAVALPDITKDTLDLLEVLRYKHPEEAAIRDGNFYLANTTIWDYEPSAPWDGAFTYGSFVGSGTFIDLPGKKAYLSFVNHMTGRIGYDWGGITHDAHRENNWYLYDTDELGKAALGEVSAGSVQPYRIIKVTWPYKVAPTRNTVVSGSYFDTETQLLYTYVKYGLGVEPVIHVYSILEGSTQTDTVGSVIGTIGSSNSIPDLSSSANIEMEISSSLETTLSISSSTIDTTTAPLSPLTARTLKSNLTIKSSIHAERIQVSGSVVGYNGNTVTTSIYSIHGRLIMTADWNSISDNTFSIEFNHQVTTSGAYLIVITTGNTSTALPFQYRNK